MSCAVSWLPTAVAATLPERRADPVLAWLHVIRDSPEEYDPLITLQLDDEPEESPPPAPSPDSAFDEILSQLGKEIYKLDEYHRNMIPGAEEEVSLSILDLFDDCLGEIKVVTAESGDLVSNSEVHVHTATVISNEEEQIVPTVNGHINGDTKECSDCESFVSEMSFIASTPAKENNIAVSVIDKSTMKPVPPPRRHLKPISSSIYETMDYSTTTAVLQEVAKTLESDSDSESTCWSYKECSNGESDISGQYAVVWSHSSGFHNSDNILRKVLSQHQATVSQITFDSTSDLVADFTVYALHEAGAEAETEVGDRCYDNHNTVECERAMTPDLPRPADDGYEPVRDAITTDENIYEEIEYSYSFTDEGCSCNGSVEIESCSISASSEGVGRESPEYANLRDNDAYLVSDDVKAWKNLLLDPYYNDDEEDEWITPEECAVYSREQRPPLVIPRITQYRGHRDRYVPNSVAHSYPEENYQEPTAKVSPVRQYDRLQEWSPTSDRRYEPEQYMKPCTDSPRALRVMSKNRLVGSTENLLIRRPNQLQLQLPASSSGDSLDIEVRDKWSSSGSDRTRKSKSMVAPKYRMRSPKPAPRTLLHNVEHEGVVKRTKFVEGTKKCKKNYTDCYMILTQTGLNFYKDQKTYYASKYVKPPGTPPSPSEPRADLSLMLHNAHIVPCRQMHTKRYARSLILTVGYDQYLIQDETEEGAKRWFTRIQNIIYKLGPYQLEDYPTPQSHSSNTDLESNGRTPPPSARLPHRAKPKDEPVFGQNLAAVCPGPETSPRVPEFVVNCIREIEKSEENMCTDGLYRASGNLSQVQKIRLEIDQKNMTVIESNPDIHVLTGSLKLFFRELKEPLLPCSIFDRILSACSIKPRDARIKEFRDIINSLPQCNRDTLKYLLEHLLRVTQYSEHNRMHTANLAIVFGPTLLWAPAEQAHNIAVDCIQQNNVVDILLTDFKEIFEDGAKTKKKA